MVFALTQPSDDLEKKTEVIKKEIFFLVYKITDQMEKWEKSALLVKIAQALDKI